MEDIRHKKTAPPLNKNYTVVRYDLSKAGYQDIIDGANKKDFSFKAFWVSDSSNNDFDVKMKVSPREDLGDLLKLKRNMSLSFDNLQDGCVLVYPAQTGRWIEITYAHHSSFNNGSIDVNNTGVFSKIDGTSYDHDYSSVSDTPELLFSASSSNIKRTIENRGGKTIYIGKESVISHSTDYVKAIRLEAGASIEWGNQGGAYARTDSGTNDSIFMLWEMV